MSFSHFDAEHCFINKFTTLIAGKWKPILLYLIQNDINRFSLMMEHVPNISRKVLTEQLRGLESDGLIYRDELKSKAPKVVIYHLTEKGEKLRQLVDEIIRWGMTYDKEEVPDEMKKILDSDFAQ
ncbi:winged helix-turn-helix transcriptional regulator [Rhodohalobacter halophilus]|uniref:winged helix-turn-helix transcriptional regulator n=1 Tax=Rhodohalobacter halophilus TaxID=1812810 RepID=UPI00083F7C8C|nr:helix-turn-helix domain-containing protein [Rhodohalobacter halophilus]